MSFEQKSDPNVKLSFLVAGVQKAGTTALHHYLCQHPQLGLPKTKELHFFDQEDFDWSRPCYNQLHDHFSDLDNQLLFGESTPIYTYWPESLKRIHAYNANIKLIILLRDPVARAYSAWRMIRAWNKEPLDFPQAIREGRERLSSTSEVPGYHRLFSYVERGFYEPQMTNAVNLFGRQNILFLTSQNLRKAHDVTLNRICEFLEIDQFQTNLQNKILFSHATAELERPHQRDLTYLYDLFNVDLKKTEKLIGEPIFLEYQ